MELLVSCQLNLKLGLVQTAYANGSSTKYINETLVNILILYFLQKSINSKTVKLFS